MQVKTQAYLTQFGSEIVAFLASGPERTIVVNCQEGLHRSAHFATTLAEIVTQTDAGLSFDEALKAHYKSLSALAEMPSDSDEE